MDLLPELKSSIGFSQQIFVCVSIVLYYDIYIYVCVLYIYTSIYIRVYTYLTSIYVRLCTHQETKQVFYALLLIAFLAPSQNLSNT